MSADLKLSLTPFLIVSNASGAAAFYEAAFDATILEKSTNDGRTNARIAIGNADFWIGDEEPKFDNLFVSSKNKAGRFVITPRRTIPPPPLHLSGAHLSEVLQELLKRDRFSVRKLHYWKIKNPLLSIPSAWKPDPISRRFHLYIAG
jgi:hypothetical protein